MNIMRVVCVTAVVAALVLVVSASETAAQSVSNRVFNGMIFARYFMSRCDADFRRAYPKLQVEKLETHFRLFKDVLTNKAAKLHPEMARDQIVIELQNTLEQRTAKVKSVLDKRECSPDLYAAQRVPFEDLGSSKFLKFIEQYKAQNYPYDRPQQLITASDGIRTYAYKYFQKIVLQTMNRVLSTSHGCSDLEVTAITLVSRKSRGDLNVPIFALPTIHYVERWEASCEKVKKTFEVTFDQHSDGGSGLYSIKPLNSGN